MKKSAFVLTLLICAALAACSDKAGKSLTGNDREDLSANVWLNQYNLHDHFYKFKDDGSGWEGEVTNSASQDHPFFTKQKFTYQLDTLSKVITITYKKKKKSGKALSYRLSDDAGRILELDGVPYVDGTLEQARFSAALRDNAEKIIDAGQKAIQELQSN